MNVGMGQRAKHLLFCVASPAEQQVDHDARPVQGKGCGELKLRMTYVPLPRVNPMVGQRGSVFMKPKGGKDFPAMVPKNPKSTNPYYIVKVGSESQKGMIKYNTIVRFRLLQFMVSSVEAVFVVGITVLPVQEPDWTGSGVAFYGVSNSEQLKITFYHHSPIGLDQDLGEVTIEISDVRKSVYRDQKGCVRKEYDLQDADSGSIEIEILFVPDF
jgi:hypothetical protein